MYGKTGWIGGLLGRELEARGEQFAWGSARMEDRVGIEGDIARERPTHVLLAAGLTGRPNVDWCEGHQRETIMANVVGVTNVVGGSPRAGAAGPPAMVTTHPPTCAPLGPPLQTCAGKGASM